MIYEYECQNPDCKFGFEIKQGIKDKNLIKCPVCGKRKLERLLFAVTGFVRKDPTTLGQQAERNMKKMGNDGVASAREKLKQEAVTARKAALTELEKKLPPGARIAERQEHKPWYGKLPQTLKKADNKKLQKYILDGKT